MTNTDKNAKILTFARRPFWRMEQFRNAVAIAEVKSIEISEKMGVKTHFFSF